MTRLTCALCSAFLTVMAACGGDDDDHEDNDDGGGSADGSPRADSGNTADAGGQQARCSESYLWLDGSDGSYVELLDPDDPAQPFQLQSDEFTVELWVKFEDAESRVVLLRRGFDMFGEPAGWALDIAPDRINAGVFGQFGQIVTVEPPRSGWHHVAWMMAVGGDVTQSVIVVDGDFDAPDTLTCNGEGAYELPYGCGVPAGTRPNPTAQPMRLGEIRDISGQISGYVPGGYDELRISSVSRYENFFTPALRHEPDADTRALFHFDEGIGITSNDATEGLTAELTDGAAWRCNE